jgi:AGCS family alanine or glycine:cation symporter
VKRFGWALLAFGLFDYGSAQEPTGLDAAINRLVEPVANAVSSVVFFSLPVGGAQLPLVVVWLIVAALFFTFYFNFINFRGFRHGFRLLRGDYDNPDDAGEVTHFQALATALSGTVGLGNIAGVAVAVSVGGPGATFWMICAGLLGMATKFVECTLGVMYRTEYPDGRISGGPMHYLNKGLAARDMAGLGRVLAAIYAVMCLGGSFGGGNMFQSNQAYQQVVNVTGGDASFFADKAWLFGLIAALAVGVVIIGGIKSIARVTEKLVPFMGVLYVGSALVYPGDEFMTRFQPRSAPSGTVRQPEGSLAASSACSFRVSARRFFQRWRASAPPLSRTRLSRQASRHRRHRGA